MHFYYWFCLSSIPFPIYFFLFFFNGCSCYLV
uniref:Uncharacterized protein n=1 Tax=Rhizophora mucronata TaxID=61149 RepID=A0A2P2JJH0_RHIMU